MPECPADSELTRSTPAARTWASLSGGPVPAAWLRTRLRWRRRHVSAASISTFAIRPNPVVTAVDDGAEAVVAFHRLARGGHALPGLGPDGDARAADRNVLDGFQRDVAAVEFDRRAQQHRFILSCMTPDFAPPLRGNSRRAAKKAPT